MMQAKPHKTRPGGQPKGGPANPPTPVTRVEPNSADCSAKMSGFGDYVDCLVDPARRCHHALEFGAGALCRHAARLQIALRQKPAAPVYSLNSEAA